MDEPPELKLQLELTDFFLAVSLGATVLTMMYIGAPCEVS